jgi:hypothetical protein
LAAPPSMVLNRRSTPCPSAVFGPPGTLSSPPAVGPAAGSTSRPRAWSAASGPVQTEHVPGDSPRRPSVRLPGLSSSVTQLRRIPIRPETSSMALDNADSDSARHPADVCPVLDLDAIPRGGSRSRYRGGLPANVAWVPFAPPPPASGGRSVAGGGMPSAEFLSQPGADLSSADREVGPALLPLVVGQRRLRACRAGRPGRRAVAAGSMAAFCSLAGLDRRRNLTPGASRSSFGKRTPIAFSSRNTRGGRAARNRNLTMSRIGARAGPGQPRHPPPGVRRGLHAFHPFQKTQRPGPSVRAGRPPTAGDESRRWVAISLYTLRDPRPR